MSEQNTLYLDVLPGELPKEEKAPEQKEQHPETHPEKLPQAGDASSRRELCLEALPENLPQAAEFVEESLRSTGCPLKTQMQIGIAVEEIFINIASYAYAPGTGFVTVRTDVFQDPAAVEITFTDSGVPCDPTARPDPDVTLPAAEREIGGLGIFMTKKLMDDVRYEYKDGKNILTLRKEL